MEWHVLVVVISALLCATDLHVAHGFSLRPRRSPQNGLFLQGNVNLGALPKIFSDVGQHIQDRIRGGLQGIKDIVQNPVSIEIITQVDSDPNYQNQNQNFQQGYQEHPPQEHQLQGPSPGGYQRPPPEYQTQGQPSDGYRGSSHEYQMQGPSPDRYQGPPPREQQFQGLPLDEYQRPPHEFQTQGPSAGGYQEPPPHGHRGPPPHGHRGPPQHGHRGPPPHRRQHHPHRLPPDGSNSQGPPPPNPNRFEDQANYPLNGNVDPPTTSLMDTDDQSGKKADEYIFDMGSSGNVQEQSEDNKSSNIAGYIDNNFPVILLKENDIR